MKRISIIVPVYNAKAYLQECFDSIFSQTVSSEILQIIAVDDGSQDNSLVLLRELQKAHDNLQVITQVIQGAAAARNAGMQAATGDYVYFCDSDDYLSPNCLSVLLTQIEQTNADFVIFNARSFGDGIKVANAKAYVRTRSYPEAPGGEMLLRQMRFGEYNPSVCLILFRRSFLEENNLWFRKGIIGEDELFLFFAYAKAQKVAYCPQFLYFRRVRPGSVMTTKQYLRRFLNYRSIFSEIEQALHQMHKKQYRIFREYAIRIAKSTLLQWRHLSPQEQAEHQEKYEALTRCIRQNRGFGDWSLLLRLHNWKLGVLGSGIRKHFKRFMYRIKIH